MHGLAKPSFTVTTEKCVTEDEWREMVKAHTDSSPLLCVQHFYQLDGPNFSPSGRLLNGTPV